MAKKSMGSWIDDVYDSVGKYIHFETGVGSVRSGKLTGIQTRVMKLNGKSVEIIDEIELNNDPLDKVPFKEIASLDID